MTKRELWWLCKFCVGFCVVCAVAAGAAFSAGIFPEPGDPPPAPYRAALASAGRAVLTTLLWPALHVPGITRITALPGGDWLALLFLGVGYGLPFVFIRRWFDKASPPNV
jgi:hypothetical protein